MPLNYSKWDQLELSDDSDIEGHPNVDKRSLIRWKQRDIHEKRETRKLKIQALGAEIACNAVLAPRLRDTRARHSADGGLRYFQQLVEKLQTSPSPEAPPTNAKDQPTYDAMMLSLLLQVWDGAKSLPADEQEAAVLSGLDEHIKQLAAHTKKLKEDLAAEENEQKKHITSEDIHEGFESKYTPAQPAPPPVKNAKIDAPTKTTTTKTTEFEVLNPASSSSKAPPPSKSSPDSDEEDEVEEELPELTPSLERFSRLSLWEYSQSFGFIQANRDVVVPGASDALLVAAFRAESKGRFAYAKQCVHQSLLLQYCEKLGKDGVRLFFQKMITGDQRAVSVFEKDVEGTYSHLKTRAKAAAITEPSEEKEPKEQIQLVPEDPSAAIAFNVPDGPPPEDLRLEGPGMEGLEVEQVRQALQMRWDVFESFSEDLKAALKVGTLEEVNKVLGTMDVSVAEDIVEKLDVAGIMSFVAGGVRDETEYRPRDADEENAE